MSKSQPELAKGAASRQRRPARRVAMASVVVCLLAVTALVGVVVLLDRGPEAPTFRRLTATDIPEGYSVLAYNPDFFRNDRDDLLLFLSDTTKRPEFFMTCVFDLTIDEVAGEGGGVDGLVDVYHVSTSSVLCHAYEPADTSPILSIGRGLLSLATVPTRSLLQRTGIAPPSWLSSSPSSGGGMDEYDYWLLDLDADRSVNLGRLMLPPREHFYYFPSRDAPWTLIHAEFQYSSTTKSLSYLVDMDAGVMRPISMPGLPIGWWDRDVVLTWTRAEGARLVDVQAGTQTLLIDVAAITGLLNQAGIPVDPAHLSIFLPWTGGDLYFTGQRFEAETSYLVKYHRADGTLELLSPDFQFGISDSFDRRGLYYLYCGRESGVGSDGVFLRDVRTGEERTLVAPAGERIFSAPFFHDERVVYRRTNELWSINIDGTNHRRLFPPP